jgi:GNAT superfamily N-acetyltransferase
MKANIDYAKNSAFDLLKERYNRISPDLLQAKIGAREVVLARLGTETVGWMTHTLLYDTVPFINLLVVAEGHRRQGIGRQMVEFLEGQVKATGADTMMTSSTANEEGQFFWREMGFRDIGGVLLAYFAMDVTQDPFQLVFIWTVFQASVLVFEIPTGVVGDV